MASKDFLQIQFYCFLHIWDLISPIQGLILNSVSLTKFFLLSVVFAFKDKKKQYYAN